MDTTTTLPKTLRSSAFLVMVHGLVLIIGYVHLITGYEVDLAIFYLAPVALATWYSGRLLGIEMSAVAAAIWLSADIGSGHPYRHMGIATWSAAAMLGFFATVSYVLGRLKKELALKTRRAETDFLTSVKSRHAFFELAEMEIKRSRRYKHPLAISYIDLDNFKSVNDTYGHDVGDELLRVAAQTLRRNLRSTDIIGRLGGDEFAVILPEICGNEVGPIVEKIQKELLHAMKARNWPVTFSIGVVAYRFPPDSVREMLKASDELMYSAKCNGRNTMMLRII
jgi:diguanylate cyclase (GGDEF)-like protein